MKRSWHSLQRQMRLSSWPALDAELVVVAVVDGAGVVPFEATFDEAEDGAAGAGAGAGAGAVLAAVSCVGACAAVGETADMVHGCLLVGHCRAVIGRSVV